MHYTYILYIYTYICKLWTLDDALETKCFYIFIFIIILNKIVTTLK